MRARVSGWAALLCCHAVMANAEDLSESAPPATPESLPTLEVPSSPPEVPPAEKPAHEQQIEEVVVTATKRAAPLREIPASISEQDGDELEKRGAQNIEDIIKVVPGVNVAKENGISRVTIRGISAANNTNATTGTLFGDVSFTDAYIPVVSLDPQPFDLQSVEVLKGPQGTLFGASALNGAVRYVPQAPVLGEFSGKYFVQYTNISQGGAAPMYGAALNVPAGDTIALRLAGFTRKYPGYVDNLRLDEADANHLSQNGIRGILAWQPGDDWKLSLTYATQETSVNDNALVDNLDARYSSNNRPRRSHDHNTYDLAVLNLEHDFDWAQFISESAYVKKHSRSFFDNTRNVVPSAPVPLLGIGGGGDSDTYSQEFRLVSNDDSDSRWRWIVGAFGSRQHVKETIDLALGDGLIPPIIDLSFLDKLLPGLGSLINRSGNLSLIDINADVVVEELALFGDVTRKLGDNWELSLGGRLYKTRSYGDNTQHGVVYTALNLSPEHVASGGVTDKNFNPKASLVWHASDNIFAYAALSKGFRVGGLQPGLTLPTSTTQAPAQFKSDTVWSYEGGVRTTWLKRKLNVDVVGFYIDWQNPQTLQYDSTTGINYLDNVGGVKSRGVDFTLRWITPFNLVLNTSASWTDTVTTAPFQTGSGNVAPTGSPWPFAPKWQTATSLTYPIYLGNWQILPSLTHTYLGKTINDLSYQEPIFNYQLLDAQIGISNAARAWMPEINFTVTNLLDEHALTSRIKQGQVTDATYSHPRTFIVRLSGSF